MKVIESHFFQPQEGKEKPKQTLFWATALCTGSHHKLGIWMHAGFHGWGIVVDEVMEEAEVKRIANGVQDLHAATGCTEAPRITVMAGNERLDF